MHGECPGFGRAAFDNNSRLYRPSIWFATDRYGSIYLTVIGRHGGGERGFDLENVCPRAASPGHCAGGGLRGRRGGPFTDSGGAFAYDAANISDGSGDRHAHPHGHPGNAHWDTGGGGPHG